MAMDSISWEPIWNTDENVYLYYTVRYYGSKHQN